MDAYQIRQIVALVLAAAAAFTAYRMAKTLKFERGAAARVSGMVEAGRQSAFDRYGERYIKTRPAGLSDHLRMAQLGGKYTDWTVGGIIARSLVYAAAALGYLLLTQPGPLFWLALPIAAVYPVMRVRSAANDTRAEIQRLMPETATALAAEMSAGASPEQALSRFGVQLDQVAGKGVEGPRVMSEVARGFAREYRAHVQMAAASLDNTLLMPMTIFFFAPFMVAILLPILLALFSAF
ncbi:MAG: hypothetical protein HY784_10725 [Chloroflexi bacterium]|nr:hypothetical protein [Chloroflexota bacterium]